MEWVATLAVYVILRLVIWYMQSYDPHPEIKLTEERRREILRELAKRKAERDGRK
jgi:hypothetical protein